MGDSRLSLALIHYSFSTIVTVSADFMAQGQPLLGECPLTEGQVFSGNPLVFQEPVLRMGRIKGFWQREWRRWSPYPACGPHNRSALHRQKHD